MDATALVLPLLLGAVPLLAAVRRVDAFAAFLEGAENGLRLTVSLAHSLVGIFVAVGVFRASGVLDALAAALAAGLLANLASFAGAVLAYRLFFGATG